MTKSIVWARQERSVIVTVLFDQFLPQYPQDIDVLNATKQFRDQIRRLGVKRREYLYVNADTPLAWGPPRYRSRRFVALTKHAEMIFKLVRR